MRVALALVDELDDLGAFLDAGMVEAVFVDGEGAEGLGDNGLAFRRVSDVLKIVGQSRTLE